MMRSGFNGHDRKMMGVPASIPILAPRPANASKWRCAAGHEYSGDAPVMALPLNPLTPPGQPQKVIVVKEVCPRCVLAHFKEMFPVTEVTDQSDGAAPDAPKE